MPRRSGDPTIGRGSKPRGRGRSGRGGPRRNFQILDTDRPASAIDTQDELEDGSEDGEKRSPACGLYLSFYQV